MARHIGQVEAPMLRVDPENIDEVAAEETGRYDVAGEQVVAKALVVVRQHANLDLSAGVLVLGQEPQAGLQVAVEPLEVSPIATVLFYQRGLLQRSVERVFEHGELDGFLHVVPGAQLERTDGILKKPRAGHHHDGQLGRLLFQHLEKAQSVEVGHAQVAQHQIGTIRPDHVEALLAIGSLKRGEPQPLEILDENLPHHLRIVDDHDPFTSRDHLPQSPFSRPKATGAPQNLQIYGGFSPAHPGDCRNRFPRPCSGSTLGKYEPIGLGWRKRGVPSDEKRRPC